MTYGTVVPIQQRYSVEDCILKQQRQMYFRIVLLLCLLVQDGDRFWRMPECYIRGSTIKYLRIPDEIIDMVKEEVMPKSKGRGEMRGRGGSGAVRGRGAPGRGGAALINHYAQ